MKASSRYEIETLRPWDSLEEWDEFVDESPQGCIFCRSWWLQAVCPEGFEILTLRKGGRIVAGMPMSVSRVMGKAIIHMPKLTQTLGVLLAPPTKESYVANLCCEMQALRRLVEAIPTFACFNMGFHYNFTNWLPFYWAGYSQTTRYTYVIPDLRREATLWDGLRSNIKTDIRKALGRGMRVRAEDDAQCCYEASAKTFLRQGIDMRYSETFFQRLDTACRDRGARRALCAVDESGRVHAASYLVWDAKSAYYLTGGGDPDLRSSGATSLLMWESVKFASKVTRAFDFEGSMIQPVERFFRAFGARQMRYFSISKDNRPLLLKLYLALRRAGGSAMRSIGLGG